MQRRDLLAGAAALPLAALARPAIAQTGAVLRFIPEGNLQNPDPIWTTTTVARNHGYLIWDTLYGLDESLTPQPQMCRGHEVGDDGLVWRFTLRDGLRFHDGEAVRAADCVASIRRWMQRDGFGRQIAARLDALEPTDDRNFRFRLNRPFPRLLRALAKPQASVLFIMPERVAQTPASVEITDFTGSGPFRFLAEQWRPGAFAAYARFPGYLPRPEPPSFTAGGKIAKIDRVEWHVIPDPATAAAALQAAEADWWQAPINDLLPLLRDSRGVTVATLDSIGVIAILRFNCLQAPFADAALRRAILPAVSQRDFMQAAMGEADLYRTGIGVFTPGSPLANDAGIEVLTGPRDPELAKRLVARSGYHGQTAVLLAPADYPATEALCAVARDLFERLGLTVEYVDTDWGNVVTRRVSRAPVEQGGWSAFCTTWEGLSLADPGGHFPIFGNGADAWYGWPTSPRLEALRAAWFEAPDLPAQQRIAEDIQLTVWQEVPYIPLGQWFQPAAFRSNLADIVKSPFPIFWGVRLT